jgi:hypothetical protein
MSLVVCNSLSLSWQTVLVNGDLAKRHSRAGGNPGKNAAIVSYEILTVIPAPAGIQGLAATHRGARLEEWHQEMLHVT